MSKGRILVVEDDIDIANMLRIYFTGQGYDVNLAGGGQEALETTRQKLPTLIILDILLPDMDGYAVCQQLRTNSRTRHIPIIFLTQKNERSDRITGLESGADDYITKPFDIEELRLRVQNAIARAERESLTDPRTGLPASHLIAQRLKSLINRTDWALLDCHILNYDAYREVYGFLAGDVVLRSTAMLLNEVVEKHGTEEDFIGHAGGESFFLITGAGAAAEVCERLKEGFESQVADYYTDVDRERGHLLFDRHGDTDRQARFMELAVGILRDGDGMFSTVEELMDAAAQRRREDAGSAVA